MSLDVFSYIEFLIDRCTRSINENVWHVKGSVYTSSQWWAACHRNVKSSSDCIEMLSMDLSPVVVHCRLYIDKSRVLYIIVPRDSRPLCRIDRAVDGSSDERRKGSLSFFSLQILFLALWRIWSETSSMIELKSCDRKCFFFFFLKDKNSIVS